MTVVSPLIIVASWQYHFLVTEYVLAVNLAMSSFLTWMLLQDRNIQFVTIRNTLSGLHVIQVPVFGRHYYCLYDPVSDLFLCCLFRLYTLHFFLDSKSTCIILSSSLIVLHHILSCSIFTFTLTHWHHLTHFFLTSYDPFQRNGSIMTHDLPRINTGLNYLWC